MSNFDFYSVLEKELSSKTNYSEDVCGLTKEPLENNYITLECGHKFNYDAFYNHLSYSRGSDGIKSSYMLKKRSMECPYCRKRMECILPFLPEKPYTENRKINYGKGKNVSLVLCDSVMKSGKRKGQCCGEPGFYSEKFGVNICKKHYSYLLKKQSKKQFT